MSHLINAILSFLCLANVLLVLYVLRLKMKIDDMDEMVNMLNHNEKSLLFKCYFDLNDVVEEKKESWMPKNGYKSMFKISLDIVDCCHIIENVVDFGDVYDYMGKEYNSFTLVGFLCLEAEKLLPEISKYLKKSPKEVRDMLKYQFKFMVVSLIENLFSNLEEIKIQKKGVICFM